MKLIVGIWALALSSIIAATQTNRSPLAFRVLQGGYWGEVYATRPIGTAGFVFFTGEQVRLRLSIASIGADAEVAMGSLDPAELFPFTVTRDGLPTSVRMLFSELSWIPAEGRSLPMEPEHRMRLKANELLEWRASVVGPLEPGLYRILFNIRASDGNGQPVTAYVADFVFEVRRSTADSRAEIARRSAMRHLEEGDAASLDAADKAIRALLRENPTSAFAELLRADLEISRGKREAARAHYLVALRRLEQGEDVMLRRFKQVRELDELQQSVKRLVSGPRQ